MLPTFSDLHLLYARTKIYLHFFPVLNNSLASTYSLFINKSAASSFTHNEFSTLRIIYLGSMLTSGLLVLKLVKIFKKLIIHGHTSS